MSYIGKSLGTVPLYMADTDGVFVYVYLFSSLFSLIWDFPKVLYLLRKHISFYGLRVHQQWLKNSYWEGPSACRPELPECDPLGHSQSILCQIADCPTTVVRAGWTAFTLWLGVGTQMTGGQGRQLLPVYRTLLVADKGKRKGVLLLRPSFPWEL